MIEKEKFTQMQWDMEELRRKCLEVELRLKTEQVWSHIIYRSFLNCNLALANQVTNFQEEKALLESEKMSLIQEREMLLHELDDAREQLSDLHKHHEEFEAKSKADVKLLVKEVKSLRSSQSELKHEFSRLLKEKIEVEVSVSIACIIFISFAVASFTVCVSIFPFKSRHLGNAEVSLFELAP